MTTSQHGAASLPVRAEIREAHERAWVRIASPGTWWSGSERVAIAAEARAARACGLCRERKRALSPASVAGNHDSPSATGLPDAIVDAAHRIASDPGRLSRRWFEAILATGVSEGHYVEAVSVTASTVAMDTFCRGIGESLRPLPSPAPGEPTRRRPTGARGGEAWVPMLLPGDLGSDDADLYGGLRYAPNILRALSLVPDEVRGMQSLAPAHYLPFARVGDPGYTPPGRAITRAQMELVAARVSALNQCFY